MYESVRSRARVCVCVTERGRGGREGIVIGRRAQILQRQRKAERGKKNNNNKKTVNIVMSSMNSSTSYLKGQADKGGTTQDMKHRSAQLWAQCV